MARREGRGSAPRYGDLLPDVEELTTCGFVRFGRTIQVMIHLGICLVSTILFFFGGEGGGGGVFFLFLGGLPNFVTSLTVASHFEQGS